MDLIFILLAYLIGSLPTAYIFSKWLTGHDIRELGDGNMGARNAWQNINPHVGMLIFFIDVTKGILAVVLPSIAGSPLSIILASGVAVVSGHNWPVYLGFRGGRGVSTAIGVLLIIVTQPTVALAIPALLTLIAKKNVVLATAVLFAPMSLVGWWMKVPGLLVVYSIALPCLLGATHFFRVRYAHKTPLGGKA